ncbi:carbonic anhydrase [Azorhizobium oxalatiphilum]|uniref:Carbonic anhydrase n=1 Tax=Azorhizobium oxalatiphilum TaxID=980631 RepID=A0A917BQB3_9HYPH|nr:carbonic anhydrase [Azorhizobium oxalatiphilum]GGF52044.1 carbonic anhydrase [Azorhizobium oxalatiphilum]
MSDKTLDVAAGADCPHCRDISHLVNGVKRFKARFYEEAPGLMQRLVSEGQSPATLMISCSDSRVDPAILAGAEPGELFVVRNVANLVPAYAPDDGLHGTGAALEYAVRDLKVDHIVVLGHAHCGGIKAMLSTAGGERPPREFVTPWVEMALNASRLHIPDETTEEGQRQMPLDHLKTVPFLAERASILGSLDNLMTYPWVRERVEAGTLALHGWWFDLDSGDLWTTDAPGQPLMPVL